MRVEGVYAGGPELAIALFSLILFVLLLFNWGSISRLLFEGEKSRDSVVPAVVSAIITIKISLLRFSGASKYDLSKNKGQYINTNIIKRSYFVENSLGCLWQFFSYYMLYCLVLVFLAKPIDVVASNKSGILMAFELNKNATFQITNIVVLVTVNVITDLLSLVVTFIILTKITKAFLSDHFLRIVWFVVVDIAAAFALFFVSQLVSNFLYPLSLENPPIEYNPWTVEAALMPYAFLNEVVGNQYIYYPVTFPGQILITGTVFVPTILGMTLIAVVALLFISIRVLRRVLDVYFGSASIETSLSPEPLAGGVVSVSSRADKCLYLAVNGMLAILQSVVAGVTVLAVGRFLGWV